MTHIDLMLTPKRQQLWRDAERLRFPRIRIAVSLGNVSWFEFEGETYWMAVVTTASTRVLAKLRAALDAQEVH